MTEDITFPDYKSKSKVCQQIQFTSQRFDANFRMTNRLINGHPLYFDVNGGMLLSMTDESSLVKLTFSHSCVKSVKSY